VTGTHEPSAEDWKRLGKAVAARRFDRGQLSQEALVKRGGPSHQIVRSIEHGRPADYRDSTFKKLDVALDWRDGTARKILLGTATDKEIGEVVIRPDSIPSRAKVGEPDFSVDEPARNPLRFGPNERIPRQTPTIVSVAELLNRLASEEKRTPTMGEAVDVLSRLLPELWAEDKREEDAMRWTPSDERE
jgi:hypothetical protein